MPAMGWEFVAAVFSIILIDIVLAGDNAVVIAMAVKGLPRQQRSLGIALGAGLAVFLRVTLTFFAAQLLQINYVKLIGGILIFWIAVKLLIRDAAAEKEGREAANIWSAIWIILVADVTMSTDNILALAGASKGNLFLLVFGLILSIPLVVFTSSILARLMDKYPIIVYAGAAVLGKVSAELMLTDPMVTRYVAIPEWGLIASEIAGAAAVIVIARLYLRFKSEPHGDSKPAGVEAGEGGALSFAKED
jgi:YjbE family integral membrane protein